MSILTAVWFPAASTAAFERPFRYQITQPAPSSFLPSGIATDSSEDLWASETPGPPYRLNAFDPFGNFLGTLSIEGSEPPTFEYEGRVIEYGLTPPGILAIDRSNGTFVAGNESGQHFGADFVERFSSNGAFLGRMGAFRQVLGVAVDNSAGESGGTIYVSHADSNPNPNELGDGLPRGVERFDSEGQPENFPSAGEVPYVAGNQILGTPTSTFDRNGPMAVDSQGNVFVVNTSGSSIAEVDEFAATGRFIRAFTGEETGGLAGDHGADGFGSSIITGVAVDSSAGVAGHLLVSLWTRLPGNGIVGAVDEFDIGSGRFLDQITESAPGSLLGQVGQLTTAAGGALYLVEPEDHRIDAWGPGKFIPAVELAEPSAPTPSSITLNGRVNSEATVNPEGSGLSSCKFEYVSETAFKLSGFGDLSSGGTASCDPAASEIPADDSFHSVAVHLTGLTSGTTYRYRLSATTAGAVGGTANTPALAFTAPHAPRVAAASAVNVSSTSAELDAQIDPLGAATAYHFEYLTQRSFEEDGQTFGAGTMAVPVPDEGIGSGEPTGGAVAHVLQQIGNLEPDTTYRFRVVASNRVGTESGPTLSFTTFGPPSVGLPDHRAYEMVTPPNKGSAEDLFAQPNDANGQFENSHDVGYPSESGNAFLLHTRAAFGPFPASAEGGYVFRRESGKWSATSLASPDLGVQNIDAVFFEPAVFSTVAFQVQLGSPASEGGNRTATVVGPAGGPYVVSHADQLGSLGAEEHTQLVGASRDMSRLYLQSANHLLAAGAAGQDEGSNALYEAPRESECGVQSENCRLVNVTSKGTLVSLCGAVLGLGTKSLGDPFEPESPFGNGGGNTYGKTHAAVSADGTRAIFTAPDPNRLFDSQEPAKTRGCWNPATRENAPQVYQRIDGSKTVEVSAPQVGAPEPGGRYISQYVGASRDGLKVFFVSQAELTTSDSGIHDLELYEYDSERPAAERLQRISAGEGGTPGRAGGAALYAVPAVSADGSAVYFLASGKLTSDAPTPLMGEVNLYRYDTASGAINYITTVDQHADWGVTNGDTEASYGRSSDPREDWYTTPNGSFLLFRSSAGQLLRYEAPTATTPEGNLICVSCGPNGSEEGSGARFARSAPEGPAAGPVVAMANSGAYVFFETADGLVPRDANRTLDVYEWEAQGSGTCSRASGCVALISSGNDSAPSFFLGASPDGANVYFGTHARLVPADTDTSGDVYDARICTTADPCIQPPPAHEGECEGDACATPRAAPVDATPSSLTYHGPGNPRSSAHRRGCRHPKHGRKTHCRRHHRRPRNHGTGRRPR
ncbi:MAG TPA: hypothetical protein VFL77_04985 [Solirubrobacterales bacterium]|nr:hypothetical protein [Solirubrobacterales bacterium]